MLPLDSILVTYWAWGGYTHQYWTSIQMKMGFYSNHVIFEKDLCDGCEVACL